ncbi:hypothetical protein, partial [Streptomyces neyagawaensis]
RPCPWTRPGPRPRPADWARRMRDVMTAVRAGAKVVLTSRDYIYRDARPYLKEYAYPLLHEQQIVVDATQLSPEERRQILYNHIKLGDQPREVRRSMKFHLYEAADADPFYPEAARRLGLQTFTRRLALNGRGIADFMARPSDYLRQVYNELEPEEKTALALTYQAGECLPAPLDLDPVQHDVVTRMGGTFAGVSRAFSTLTGTFLRQGPLPSNGTITGWAFRHPTLQEGFAAFLATDPNLIKIFLSGKSWRVILRQIDCDTRDQAGTLLRVPPSLYPRVIEILRTADQETLTDWLGQRVWHEFLASRCSDEFLALYAQAEPAAIIHMTWFTSFLNVVDEPQVLARLQQADLIDPAHHQLIVERVTKLAVESPDAGWTWLPEWKVLLTDTEREQLLSHVKQQLPSRFDQILQDWRGKYNPDEADPHTYFEELEIELTNYREAFADDADAVSAIDQALEKVNAAIWVISGEFTHQGPHVPAPHGHSALSDAPYGRSIFDDIDDD